MTKILALSGKKQSGKNTAVNYILGLHLNSLGIVKDGITIIPKGAVIKSGTKI